MRILYVLHQFFPNHFTGTERLTLQIAKQIQRMGHFVSVLAYEPNRESEGFVPLDENILKREHQVDTIPVISFKSAKFRLGFYVFDPMIEKYLFGIVQKFDVVHFTHPMRFGSVLKVCKQLGIPTVLTLTDNWLLCPQGLLTKDLKLCDGPDEGKKCMETCKYDDLVVRRYNDAKFFFDNVDLMFSGSEFVIQTFMENGWNKDIRLNTFSVDYSFVKPEEGNGASKELVFGFIGSMIWHKGLHILIDAFKKVEKKNIKLKIYGRGVEGDSYYNHVVTLSHDDKRIEFCGTFDYEDLPKVMKEISILVIPSTYKEIYPLVMQMGFAYNKPIIATNIGGMPEVVKDKVNGFLFEIGKVDQLVTIIEKIAENPSLVSQLQQNIKFPPPVEEEAFAYESAYRELSKSSLVGKIS